MGNYVEYFNKKIEDIGELVLLPNEVRMYAINALRGMNKAAVERRGSQHPIDSAIKTLQNIKDDSINNKYKIVYNQLNILATSALEATLKHYFIDCLRDTTLLNRESDKLKRRLDSIKVTAFDLVQNDLNILVHRSGRIDKNFIRNTENNSCIEANIKEYKEKDEVGFDAEDWKDMKQSYVALVKEVTKN